ncbi:hypothetical protein GCM10023237_69510 [Streptomyces coeruleoprunus]
MSTRSNRWSRGHRGCEQRPGAGLLGAVEGVAVGVVECGRQRLLPGAHPEVDWAQLRTVGKGRRSPLAGLQTQSA